MAEAGEGEVDEEILHPAPAHLLPLGLAGDPPDQGEREKIFNLFLFIDDQIAVQLGGCCHQADGSDREKLSFFLRQVKHDLPGALRSAVPKRYLLVFTDGTRGTGLQYQSYQKVAILQRHIDLFEEVFAHYGASDSLLMCITPVVAGEPKIEAVSRF